MITLAAERTEFGLEVLPISFTRVVREADIKRLPFYDFRGASMAGSILLSTGQEEHVYLHDSMALARLFIAKDATAICRSYRDAPLDPF